MQTFHKNRQTGSLEVGAHFGGGYSMGKGGGEAREMESKCVDKRPMLEDEKDGGGKSTEERRGVETGGMCFPSGPSGAAFHWRYPEGDPHLVF